MIDEATNPLLSPESILANFQAAYPKSDPNSDQVIIHGTPCDLQIEPLPFYEPKYIAGIDPYNLDDDNLPGIGGIAFTIRLSKDWFQHGDIVAEYHKSRIYRRIQEMKNTDMVNRLKSRK